MRLDFSASPEAAGLKPHPQCIGCSRHRPRFSCTSSARIFSPLFHVLGTSMVSCIPPKPSTETSESDRDQHEEALFGYPLQRMVPLESMRLGGEESPLLRGLYSMPTSQSSSTSSHMLYVYVVPMPSILTQTHVH